MTSGADRWFDDAAGPVVRPYAMTRGRTSHAAEDKLDLIALVVAEARHQDPGADTEHSLSPEQLDILEFCRDRPVSVAEIASHLDLPIGVVRVLIGDLLDAAFVQVGRPVPPAELPAERILRDVINGLQAL